MKEKIMKSLPDPAKKALRVVLDKKNEIAVHHYDKKRFSKNRLRGLSTAEKNQIEGKLIFHAHAIEKGLSHDEIRLGFGRDALKGMADALRAYNSKSLPKADEVYVNALSTLKAYIDLHEAKKFDVSYLDGIFSKDTVREACECTDSSGGAMVVKSTSKADNKKKNFKDLFQGRVSVRTYSDSPVDLDKIRDAVELSMKTPSVCNRQSARVQILTNQKMIARTLKVQGGVAGYATPPILLIVTTDTGKFLAPTERNQIYTDGGLFAMALLLALEYEGLAACPLNAMLNVKQEKAIRRIIDLPENENVVMFMSVGNFKKENNVPKSFRVSGESVTRELS